MAESKVKLPNGEQVTIRHKDGASEQDVLQFAFSEYVVNQDPGTVIGRSIAQGIDNLQQAYGSSLEGIGNILDAESLQQMGGDIVANNQAQIDARRFREQESLTDREGVAGAFDYVAELAGQSAPQMVTAFAGAGAGGAIGLLGGPLAPLTVPIGAFAGGFLANMPYFYGSNRERQKEAVEKGYKVEMDEGAAALAAIPQSALDAVFGAVGAKFLSTPLMKLQGGILTKATVGAGTGSVVEAPTEIGQTVLERYQAGLPLDDDEALKEIVAAGVGGAVLGGLFGGAGGAVAGIRTPKETKAVEEKEQGERQTFTVNYTNESTGQPTSTEVEADNEQQAQEIANKSLNKTAREGTIVVQKPVEPEPAPTPDPEPEIDTSKDKIRFWGNLSDQELDKIIENRVKDAENELENTQEAFDTTESEGAWKKGAREKTINELEVVIPRLIKRAKLARDRAIREKQGRADGSLKRMTDEEFGNQDFKKQTDQEPTPEPIPEPVVEVDNEAIKEQQDIIDDADSRVFDLQSEIEIEKSNIKEARANTKKDIANVRKSNLSKEDKAEKVEDLKAELQDTVDEINDNIDIYKEEMSEFRSELRKAKKKLTKLQPPEVTAGAAAVGLTPKEFTSRLKDTTVVDNEGKPLKVYRGTRNIEFETEGRGRVPSFTSSPDVASTYSSTMRGGPFDTRLSFKEGASVSPVFLSMKKPLDFTAEENLMSLGNYLAYMEYGNEKVTGKNGITKEEVDKLINYMVRRGRGKTKAKGDFVFRLDDSFTTPEGRPLDFSRDEYSDLVEFKDEYDDYLDNNLSLEDPLIQDGLYFDQFIAADAPVTKRVAERLGFDGIIHKDAFGLKEEYEQLTGKKVEGLTQEAREDDFDVILDDIHITYRPFSEEQVIGSLQQPDVTAEAAPVTTEDYNLLNSPFIKGYSGPGPQDASVPNYNSFHYVLNNPQRQALSSAIESGAVDALADNLVQETTEMMKDPSVSAGMGWYGRMRTRLNQIFGGDRDLFTHLLGTTSAQTAVEQNFRYSVDLYNRFKAGEFDSKIKKYLELKGRLQAGDLGKLLIRIKAKNSDGKVYTEQLIKKSKDSALLQAAARHYDLLPKQKNGKLYGANSYPALKALSQVWFDDRLGPNRMTPKTPQFAMNLNGQSLEATIDVWAARSLRRIIYKGQPEARIVPSEETAVSNPDFALGQLIFGRAAKKLNMNPDDLQAVIWFGEKKIWDQNGWTGAAGALKSSFDEPANVFYPIDGTTRSEADANLILDFLASERLVQRDIAFPEAVSLTTQANNRKKYDEYIRTSVISDFLESRGRREVYESESVESDRRRQVTRAINRLRGFSGKVRYRKGTGKEPKRSLGVIERGSVLSGKQFASLAKRNKSGNKFGSSVDVLTETEYESYDLIVIDSGPGVNVTLSISPDGEVGSVTKSPKATKLDVAAAFDMAISTGKVQFLNGFETVLPDIYASHGFVPVARLKFNPEFQPDGWSTQTYKKYNNGQPDIIFMRPGGQVGGTYNSKGFPEVSTYEEGVALSKDIIAEAAPTEPGGTFNQNTLYDFITDNFLPVSRKIGVDIVTKYDIAMARYNASQGVIEYNPTALAQQDQQYITAAMREEMIHAAMSKVILQKAKGKKEGEAFKSFMSSLGKSLTPEQRTAIAEVYSGLETDAQFGAEYSRAAIQQLLYGDVTESFITQGPAFTKLKNLLRSVQSYLARTFGADVTTDPEAAGIIRASAELLQAADPNARPTNQKVVDESLAYSASVDPNAEVTSQEVAESGKPPSQKKLNINFARKYLFTLSSLLNSIHPRLKKLVRDYYGAIQGRVLNYQTRVAPFFKKHKGIKNEKDKRRIKQLLLYSPPGDPDTDPLIQEQNRLLRKYDMLNDYNLEVRPVFDELRADLIDKGIEVGYLPDYMARAIKDLDKVKNRSGNELNEAFKNYIDQRNKEIQEAESRVLAFELNPKDNEKPTEAQYKLVGEVVIEIGSDRTAAFEAQQWDVFTLGTKPGGGSNLPGNLKERTAFLRDVIPDDLLDAYEDPSVAMERYIFSVVSATESIKLVGRKFMAQGNKIEVPKASDLGLLIQELRANGEISNENADGTVPDIFRMILTPQQGENIFLQLSRTFGYGTLLVEFTSTLSQLYDLPFIMLDNGVLGTAGAMFGQRLKGEDFGIDTQQVSAEFAGDNRALEKAVRLGLKATGFTKLDQIMKETNLTANYNRYRKLSRGYYKDRKSANSKKFVAELTSMGYSEQEQVKLIADLKDGKRNSAYIRSLLFNKLAETQPLTQAEMALGIVNNPNLRLFVAMKSFMVSQLNFFKDRIILNMFGPGSTNAQRVQASKDLALLLTFLVMAGLPVDALKDFLAGRIGYMSDYLFNGVFRIAGISRYTAYQARKEGIGQATLDFVTPVAVQQFVDITSEMGRVATGQKAITESKFVTLLPFSDVINRVFGFQKERERREYMRRSREGERPFLIPAGAI